MTTDADRADEHVLRVDDKRLWFPRSVEPDTTYDVVINGQHVWSLQPGRDTQDRDGVPVAPWPKALRRHLVGRADVAIRDHVSGSVLATARHVFAGEDEEEVSVTDPGGHALVLDKWGRLTRPLSGEDDDVLIELVDEVVRLLDVLRERAGVPAYICYGTLLGAVRDGRLIGHDNDIDVAYVSRHPYPVDVVREGYRIERVLQEAGWVVRRGSGVRLNVRLHLSDGSWRFVDVFTSHWVEGVLYIPSDTGFRLPEETILPLSTVSLMGREVPAPADCETLLAATYGPSWRVPDPSFKYTTPRSLSRRLGGWFGGLATHRKHWDGFVAKSRGRVPTRPSPFARWVAAEHPSTRPIVDVGAGNGRDAVWFAKRHKRSVIAVDYSVNAVNRGRRLVRNRRLRVAFEVVNLYDVRAVLSLGARLSRIPEPADIYVRFTLHALEPLGRENVLRLASMALRRGGLLFLEFRTPRDRRRKKAFGPHPRRFVAPAGLVADIEAAGGRVLYRVEDTGLARFEDEDPCICRIVATWT